MPDAATIEAARPCCPECGEKLTRAAPPWITHRSRNLWYCANGVATHRVRTWHEDLIGQRLSDQTPALTG